MQLSSFDQKQAKYSTPIRFVSIQADFQSSLCKLSAILDVLTRRKEETSLLRVPQKILVVSLCTIIQSLCFTVHSHRMASYFSPGQKKKKNLSSSRLLSKPCKDDQDPGSQPGWGLCESLQAHLPVSILPGSHSRPNGPHQSQSRLLTDRVRTRTYLFMTNS